MHPSKLFVNSTCPAMTHVSRPFVGALLLLPGLVWGCSSAPAASASPNAGSGGLPAGHPVVQAPRLQDAPATPVDQPMTGIVQETLEGGGYTYARVDFGGDVRWVAGPQSELSAGDTVMVPDMASMGPFSSPSLQRSFDQLYFTGSFVKPGEVSFENSAVVAQAIPAGQYVYLEVSADEGTKWLAAPALEVQAGDSVGWNGGSLMKDFTSSTLGRTFAEILFVEGVTVLR